jgi:hypothetical protein
MKKIVKKILDSDLYKYELTGLTDAIIEFSVWRLHDDENEESDDESDEEAPAPEELDDGVEQEKEDEAEVDALIAAHSNDRDDSAPTETLAPEGTFFFEGSHTAPASTRPKTSESLRMPPFLYRHIRKVTFEKNGGYYIVKCTCEDCDAVCSPCRHMFRMIRAVAPTLKLCELPWHPRNLKSHYWKALFEDESCNLQDLIHSVSTGSATPKISSSHIEIWLQTNTDVPCTDNVPLSGRLTETFQAFDDCDGGFSAFDSQPFSGHSLSKRKPAVPDKAAADQLHWQITECLGKQHSVYKEYCDHLRTFRNDLLRRGIETAGPGKRGRIPGFWEGSKHGRKATGSAAKMNAAPQTAVLPVIPEPAAAADVAPEEVRAAAAWGVIRVDSRLLGLTGKRAWHFLQKFGPTVNDIVQVQPDTDARRAGEKWFMIVKKAKMITVDEEECIESCRWCKTNTLQPCNIFKDVTPCRLENVIAYGVRDAPIFKDLVTVQTAAPPVAAPPVSNAVVLAKVVELRKQQEVACTHDMFCVCSACS